MVDQASMKVAQGANGISGRASTAAETTASPAQVVSNVAGFGENLLNMAELQARMTAIELRQNMQSLKAGAAVVLIGTIMALTALPILLAGIAELLVTQLALGRGSAFLAVGLVTFFAGALFAVSAALWIERKRLGFPLSAEEFARNLNWVRTVLRFSGRPRY
jgi:hypothetical protein